MYKRKDTFYQQAKAAGYRSRAAYKLLELNQEWRFLRRGQRVIDLGSWPGGWAQVAGALVGREGTVAGCDLAEVQTLALPQVTFVRGDAADPRLQGQLLNAVGGRAHVLLSDMAPKLTGIRETDEARAMALCRLALACAAILLQPNGSLLLKVFMGPDHKPFVSELRAAFSGVKTSRPTATRKSSAETYVLASGARIST